jgi:hypothetical protein
MKEGREYSNLTQVISEPATTYELGPDESNKAGR